jgi:hypothetical protein
VAKKAGIALLTRKNASDVSMKEDMLLKKKLNRKENRIYQCDKMHKYNA